MPGRTQPLCLCRELLAEALVRVRELPLCERSGAVFLPELLDEQLVALLLALDVEPHVRLQVGVVLLPAAAPLREELVLDRGRVHAEDLLVGQVVLPDRLRRFRDVTFADVQDSCNLALAVSSLQQHQEDLLHLCHRHSFPSAAPRIGRLRRILWRHRHLPICGTRIS